ncbi:branched-chain amino acid transport system II carrier protein [Garciella nitratireducens]|uniref:Branched-chain amino acid transport system carrier protein n=1 Tax=Garciella nitratireducens DSM 15102 TaxID=1121911 RepID=A0A1T4NVS0_9FIRM|nr:branched-chain amino acid transport system II carrier protein [Garciella nitratireducens]RBP46938.1 LIVCS family branched-chain amino acid:cation transporter [Garciella nitratireducens]SJZ83323.1 branched-chain amino acid:cation transporter, LIVCS family [Garciella nitratireducens DSM 15102]
MEKVSRKHLLLVSLMIFSMFFGAGNLIFPPQLGQLSGTHLLKSLMGFLLSAVGLPVLAIAVVAKAGGLHVLASRVHPRFAFGFTILIYLSIGPFLGIPRAASLAFEMGILPFLSNELSSSKFPLFMYTLIFFTITFWLCLAPSKLVDRFGKVLTPVLLLLMISIFITNLFNPIGNFTPPTGDYINFPILKGFLDGYMTMDAIAALNFGIVISNALKTMGITKKKYLVSNSIKAGAIAGLFLTIIYGMLAYLGAVSNVNANSTENGAQVLTKVVFDLFGKKGSLLLGLIFSLACLTTSVGLLTSCSQYFEQLIPKVSYKTWVVFLSFSSIIFANVGLTQILKISIPMLTAIYPVAIVLIFLELISQIFKENSIVYLFSIVCTSIVSILDALGQFGIKFTLLNYLPLYSKGLGWIVPAIAGILIGCIYEKLKIRESQQNSPLNLKKSRI